MLAKEKQFIQSFTNIGKDCYANAKAKGFWEKPRNTGEAIALMHAELSEMLEYLRKSQDAKSDHIPEFLGVEEEGADVIIRLMDLFAANKWRLGEAIIAKMAYNETRPKMHGKKF